MRIDNNHWKHIQKEKNKACIARTLQNHLPQTPQTELTRGIADERSIPLEQCQKDSVRAHSERHQSHSNIVKLES